MNESGVGCLIREESEDGESDGRYPFSDSSSDESVSVEGLENNLNDRLGYLYLQYFELSSPYTRVPLMDKVCYQPCFFPWFASHMMR